MAEEGGYTRGMSDITPAAGSPDQQRQMRIRVKYDELSAKYASQVLINSNAEEFFLDFSSGIVNDPSGGDALLQIHTRIAMSPGAAARLHAALGKVLTQAASPAVAAPAALAGLPKLDHPSRS